MVDGFPRHPVFVVGRGTLPCWSRHDLVCPSPRTTDHDFCRHSHPITAWMHPAGSSVKPGPGYLTTPRPPPMPVVSTERFASAWDSVAPSRVADWAPSTTAGPDTPSSSLRRGLGSNPGDCSNCPQTGQSSWDSHRDHWMLGRFADLHAGTVMEEAPNNIGRGTLTEYMRTGPCRDPKGVRRGTGLALVRLSSRGISRLLGVDQADLSNTQANARPGSILRRASTRCQQVADIITAFFYFLGTSSV